MKKAKLTKWFPPNVNPVHVGVYERQYHLSSWRTYCLWNGNSWLWPEISPSDAALCTTESTYQLLPWRGLAEKPE